MGAATHMRLQILPNAYMNVPSRVSDERQKGPDARCPFVCPSRFGRFYIYEL